MKNVFLFFVTIFILTSFTTLSSVSDGSDVIEAEITIEEEFEATCWGFLNVGHWETAANGAKYLICNSGNESCFMSWKCGCTCEE